MYKKTALVAAGFLVMMGAVFVSPDVQAQTVNVTQVKSKIIKLKGNANQLRHASKSGWINITSKTKITKALRATKAIDVRKHLINKKGAVKVKDDLTVTGALTVDGTVNGITLSDLASDVAALQTSSVYTAGSGLSLANNAFSLSTDCDSSEILKWDGDSWECATDATGGSGTTYTAGTGISISGSVISSTVTDTNTTYTAGTGITITSEAIAATLGTAITSSEITDGTIVSADISDGTIASADIADGTVTAADLGADSVGASELSSSAIEAGDIALGDLPAIASTNLSNTANIPLLDTAGTITGDWVNTTNPWADNEVVDALTISGGTINGTPIGATTASTGNFSNLSLFGDGISTLIRPQLTNSGTSATLDATVGTPLANNVEPSVIVNSDGDILIAYHDSAGGAGGTLKLAICAAADALCASPTITEVDATNESGYYASIALLPNGNPIISHFNNTARDILLEICTDSTCTSSTQITIDSTGNIGYAGSLALTTDGYPIMSYMDLSGNVKVAACDDASACAGATITTIQTDGSTSALATSIALNPNTGYPVIAYIDSSTEDLSLTLCSDKACTGDTTVVMDATIAAEDLSLTISGDGFPLVAYSNGTDLLTAACTTAGCAEANATITIISSTAGKYVSATTGVDGFPVIAYESNATDDLQVVKCGSTDCAIESDPITIDSGTIDNAAIAINPDGRPIIAFHENTDNNLEIYRAANRYVMDNFFTR